MAKPVDLSVDMILRQVRPTPVARNQYSDLTEDQKIQLISEKFKDILEVIGLDLTNDSLAETPARVARMYLHETFSGLNPRNFPKLSVIENEMQFDQMIVVRDIETLSICEHHLQTIDGKTTVAYVPNNKVIGLSKINRIVQFFSKRPQVQERLTKQIADCLAYVLDTPHVAVNITARHYCVVARGVGDTSSITSTSDLRGDFKNRPETRSEFLAQCQINPLTR